MKLDRHTVGRRYGKALFELSEEKNQLESVYQELLELRKIYQMVPDVGNILSDVRLEPDEKQTIMDELFNVTDGIVHNFLQVVFSYGRMDDLLLMIEEYERRYDQKNGTILGTITTAVPLSEDKKQLIEAKIAQRLGYQKAELTPEVDEKIIGGVIVETEHKVLDGSVATRFRKMREQLRNNR